MKRKLLCVILSVVMLLTVLAGCTTEPPGQPSNSSAPAAPADSAAPAPEANKPFKVGVSLQSLANSYWAGVFGEVESILKAKGWDYTIVDCKDNSGEQISQIENFVAAGCDMIMVHPSDPAAIEDVCKAAREAGVKVMSWDDKMTNTDVNWVLENTELGYAIGSAAADFINKHFSEDNKAEVAIINYPQTPILLERENGILAALEAVSGGKYTIVAQQPALDAGTAQSHLETILQANPNTKIVCSIGAGGDIGANEAYMAAFGGKVPEDVGIFSADATLQQLQAIQNGEASRVSVGFEGSNKRTAEAVVDLYEKLLTGADLGSQNIVRPLLPIGIENVAGYIADYK